MNQKLPAHLLLKALDLEACASNRKHAPSLNATKQEVDRSLPYVALDHLVNEQMGAAQVGHDISLGTGFK